MAFTLAVTQFPHASWLNGGLDADARDYRLRTTQFTPNGPRIASAVASLSPGDFTTVWASATGSLFEVQRADDGTAAQITDWTPTAIWHAVTEQVLFAGARGTIKLLAYAEVFGDWREMHTPAVMGRSVNGTAHWYGNIAQDGAGNVYYGTTTSVAQTWRLNPSTEVWTQLQSTPSYSQLGSSLEWFPDANSGAGGLIKLLDFATSTLRVILLNAAGTSWSTLASGVPNSQHALPRYHPNHNRVLILGGTNTQTAATFLEADGTATASATAIPANIHGMSPACWVAAHSSGCWLVRSGASGRVYAAWPNATYDDITWVDLGTAPDSALTNPTIVQGYATDTLLIVSTTGLHAWRVPNVGTSIAAGVGSATASGPSATISAGSSTTIAAEVGAAAASGLAASVRLTTAIAAAVGTATASGLSAGVSAATRIAGAVATATASGLQATLTRPTPIAATVGAADGTGQVAAVRLTTALTAGVGTAEASGLPADVSISGATVISAGVATAAASGLQATIVTAATIAAGVAAAEASGLGAQIVLTTRIGAGVGAAAASGLAAGITVSTTTTIAVAVGVATASGRWASITVGTPAPPSTYLRYEVPGSSLRYEVGGTSLRIEL
jgi:hypothetical protein